MELVGIGMIQAKGQRLRAKGLAEKQISTRAILYSMARIDHILNDIASPLFAFAPTFV
jgi:hypothetical protein